MIMCCILFVTNTGDAEYLKLSEVDSAVENFARDASNQCEDTAVSEFITFIQSAETVCSIFTGGVRQVRFVLSRENHEFFTGA